MSLDELKDIIKRNVEKEFYTYLENNNIISDNENNFKEILIYSLNNNASLEIIEYIIKQRKDENLNFDYTINGTHYVPLFSAISKNNFKIADLLIKNKANINYYSKNNKQFIVYNLFRYNNSLNDKNLKYILHHNFFKSNISNNLILSLIDEGKFDLIEIIFGYYKYNTQFILKLLNLYKNQTKSSRNCLNKLIISEKEKIIIEDDFYNKINNSNEKILPKILFEYESCDDKTIIRNKIIKYELLEKMIVANECKTVEKMLCYEKFNYKYYNYKEILSNVITNNNLKMAKLLIESFIFSSGNQETGINSSNNQYIYTQYLNLILNIVIELNNMELIKYLIKDSKFKKFVNINMKDINGEYPIIISFFNNNINIFKYLIWNGADCNTIDNNGISLLSLAIINDKVDIIRILLSRSNIEITRKDKHGNTPFLKAIIKGDYEIIKLLINYGKKKKIDININEKDECGNYPLISSVNNNDLDTVMLLLNYALDNKKDINVTDKEGLNPLMISYSRNFYKIFKYLLKFYDINIKDSKGRNILFYAINKRDVKTTENLINMGADINSEDNEGVSIIDYAIQWGAIEIVKILLKRNNLPLNKRNSKGKTILINIINSSIRISYKKELITLLIERGVNMNIVDNDGNSALYYSNNFSSIGDLLTKNGAIYIHK